MPASVQRFYIKAGKLLPVLELRVTSERTGEPMDFTGWTGAAFSMRREDKAASLLDSVAALYVSPLTMGLLRHVWLAGETDGPGVYRAEFHGVDAGGKPATIPNGGYVEVHILPGLDS